MTRSQAIDLIKAKLDALSDDQLAALVDIAKALSSPTLYSTLSAVEKAEIDAALDELDRGEGVPWSSVKTDLEAKIKSAGA